MRRHRYIILALIVLAVSGSIGFTSWYAARLHSKHYLHDVEQQVTEFFGMPCQIAEVRPRSFYSRDFLDVTINMRETNAQVFNCELATWREGVEASGTGHRLELQNGRFVLGDALWEMQRYKHLIRPEIGADIGELNLRVLRLEDFAIQFERDGFQLSCSKAGGDVVFTDSNSGTATFVANRLNGRDVPDGVRIVANLISKPVLSVSDIRLTVPALPLPDLGLDAVLGTTPTSGVFAGKVAYMAGADGSPNQAELEGLLQDVQLAEFTQRAPYGPYEGRAGIRVDRARIANRSITHFRGGGRLDDVVLAPLATPLGFDRLDGVASFVFDEINLALSKVERIRFNGRVERISLEQLLRKWGKGSATGVVKVRIDNFEMVGETIRAADIEVSVAPPANQKGFIDRALLLDAAERGFGFEWPAALPKRLLPAKIEYVDIGARLLVRDNKLRVLGTHGSDGRAIITIREPVFGRALTIFGEPGRVYDLTPYVKQVLETIQSYQPDEVKQWLEEVVEENRRKAQPSP